MRPNVTIAPGGLPASGVLPVTPDPRELLQRHWGHHAFRPMQEEVIRSVLDGRDTLALLPTGGGKSLCYQLPALALGGLTIVVSPLIALMRDQVDQARRRGIAAMAVMSCMAGYEIDNALEDAALGRLRLLYVSPERLGTDAFRGRLPRMPVHLIAVDEAHCIAQWGYDFRPAYMRIPELRAVFPQAPVVALTATATPAVVDDIQHRLGFRAPNVLRSPFHRPELTFWCSRGEDKLTRLHRIVDHVPGSGIVYMRDRRGTVELAGVLQRMGVTAGAYHAGLPHTERERVQRDWQEGRLRYVAATNAFGMGIDKGDVRTVVHLSPPPDLESYYQEAGRAGRDGRPSYAFLLVDDADDRRLRERVEGGFPTTAEVRRTYQAFADTHRIALGSGLHESYTLDLRDLARRSGLKPATALGALKALELNDDLVLSEGVHTPSRVLLTCGPSTVHGLRLNDARLGPLLEALLRLYGGLFEAPAMIEEERVAQVLSSSTTAVREGLRELQRLEVLRYSPRTDDPLVTLMTPRRDAQRLTLDPEALDLRLHRALERVEAMAAYFAAEAGCREATLLSYFGEGTTAPCGRCDRCRSRCGADATSPVDGPDAELLRWEQDQR
ncbi:MAG: RecQ family ATP-dependent DNA helicase [Flavobacteriales bacterium]|nr:RecQ family ATP-dependent DNA helicase [Flavobacteriales bacterium]